MRLACSSRSDRGEWRALYLRLPHYLNAFGLKIEEGPVLWTCENCEIEGAQDLIYVKKKKTSFMPKGKIKAPGPDWADTGKNSSSFWLKI